MLRHRRPGPTRKTMARVHSKRREYTTVAVRLLNLPPQTSLRHPNSGNECRQQKAPPLSDVKTIVPVSSCRTAPTPYGRGPITLSALGPLGLGSSWLSNTLLEQSKPSQLGGQSMRGPSKCRKSFFRAFLNFFRHNTNPPFRLGHAEEREALRIAGRRWQELQLDSPVRRWSGDCDIRPAQPRYSPFVSRKMTHPRPRKIIPRGHPGAPHDRLNLAGEPQPRPPIPSKDGRRPRDTAGHLTDREKTNYEESRDDVENLRHGHGCPISKSISDL